jgi:NADPH:quinone reductase
MRAVLVREFGGIEAAGIAEVPEPIAGPDEVLIAIQAAPVNYADLLVIAGRYQTRPSLPFIPGKSAAGRVTAVGEAVTRFGVGDRVFAWVEEGGYAETVAAPEGLCYPLPAAMRFVDAAALGLDYAAAWFALRDRARFRSGETVLVLGASGAVGFAAVQLAKTLGARVLAGIATPDKTDLAQLAGADVVIELWRPDLRDSLRVQVRDATGGHGADIILDPVGADVFDAALRALAWRGRMVVIGFAAGQIPSIKANYLLVKNIEVSGLQVSDYKTKAPADVARCFAELFALHEAGKIAPFVMATCPLEQFADGLRQVRNRTVRRKIVLAPRGQPKSLPFL